MRDAAAPGEAVVVKATQKELEDVIERSGMLEALKPGSVVGIAAFCEMKSRATHDLQAAVSTWTFPV